MDSGLALIRMNTPVHTGYLRYNWYWTTQLAGGINPIRGGERDTNRTYPDVPWNQARQSIVTNTNTWYIINNVTYGVGLNEGSGRGGSYVGATLAHSGFFDRAIRAFILGEST